jgi:hypothetical protein
MTAILNANCNFKDQPPGATNSLSLSLSLSLSVYIAKATPLPSLSLSTKKRKENGEREAGRWTFNSRG